MYLTFSYVPYRKAKYKYMGMVFASLGMIASFLGYGMNLNREELVDHY